MNIYNLKFKIFVTFLLSAFYLLLFPNFVFAQAEPQFLFSWRARAFVPSWYQGKILPTNKTPIDASFELIVNGKTADLSKTKVRWYVNDTLIKNEDSGLGIKKVTFFAPDFAGGSSIIKIILPEYPSDTTQPTYVTEIPVTAPEAIISAPYLNNEIGSGQSLFRAIPFFFNGGFGNLSINWLINNEAPNSSDGDPFLLNLNIGSGAASGKLINVSVFLKNLTNNLDFANKSINLTVK